MYTSILLTTVLASTTLAVPNMIPKPYAIPPASLHREGIAHSSAGYGLAAESTTMLTLFTTVYTPRATITQSAVVSSANSTAYLTATTTLAKTCSSMETSTSAISSISTRRSSSAASRITTNSTSATRSSSTESLTSTTTSTSVPELSLLAGVYICSDINWSGICKHYLTPIGSSPSACTLLNGTASSIGPDMGFSCNFYTNSYCDSVFNDRHDVIALEYPGTADLRNLQQGDYNDGFYSYQCFEKVE